MTVSPAEFKNVMASVAGAVTVVTARDETSPIGLTVSAFMSVSADPAIVLVCIDKATASLPAMLSAEGYTVNMLAEGSDAEAMLFATPGADKFGESAWRDAEVPEAGPVLESAHAHLECVVVDRHEVGDHWVLYAEVHGAHVDDPAAAPLIWHNRGFAKLKS